MTTIEGKNIMSGLMIFIAGVLVGNLSGIFIMALLAASHGR